MECRRGGSEQPRAPQLWCRNSGSWHERTHMQEEDQGGEATQATKFSQELALELVEEFEDVVGSPSGMLAAQFSVLKLDAI